MFTMTSGQAQEVGTVKMLFKKKKQKRYSKFTGIKLMN